MSGLLDNSREFFKDSFGYKKLSALLAISALLVFIGAPNQPHSVISGIKAIKASTVKIELPIARLSKKLSVNQCSEDSLNNLYSDLKIYNSAKSGINVFKTRLAKEKKNSFTNLSYQLLNASSDSAINSNTCILPLKINAETKLAKQIATSDLLEVSLGSQSVFCSNQKAHILAGSNFFQISDSLANYGSQITKKKIVLELSRRLTDLNKRKRSPSTNKKTELEAIGQEIRKTKLLIAYAKYFANDSKNLGQLFDQICNQAAIVTTPNALPPVNKTSAPAATKIPTLVAPTAITAVPTATKAASATIIVASPTVVNAPTILAGRPSAPVISAPNLQNAAGTVTLRWQSSSQRFLLGAVNKTNNTDILFVPDFTGTSYNLNVITGNSYRFWIRARKDIYNQNDLSTFSELTEVIFTVPGVAPIATATPATTAPPVATLPLSQSPDNPVQRIVNSGGSITSCINQSAPGDSCIVSSGNYPEIIKPSRSGLALHPITVKAAAGADVKVEGLDLDSVMFVDILGLKFKSFTRDLITWKLDNYYLGGTYVNGDSWVKGPVTLTGFNQLPAERVEQLISTQCDNVSPVVGGQPVPVSVPCSYCAGGTLGPPNSHICEYIGQWRAYTYVQNKVPPLGNDEGGTVLNLNSELRVKQGLTKNEGWTAGTDDHQYDSSLNIALQLPKVITVSEQQPIQSLLSVSGSLNGNYAFSHAAALTVVHNQPEPRDFRPPYSGPVKITTGYNINDALSRIGLLKSKAPPAGSAVPNLTELINAMKKLVVEKAAIKKNGSYFKSHGTPMSYGVQISAVTSKAALFLQTNASIEDKAKIMIYLLQYGLDIYGGLNNKLFFMSSGGHQPGKLIPFYMAARLLGLGDDKIQQYSRNFCETDQQGYAMYQGRIIPEWGDGADTAIVAPFPNARHWTSNADGTFNGYRFTSNAGHTGAVLAMMIMEDNNRQNLKNRLGGGSGYSKQNAFIDYIIDIFYPIQSGNPKAHIRSEAIPAGTGVGGGDNDINIFTHRMWQAYGPN